MLNSLQVLSSIPKVLYCFGHAGSIQSPGVKSTTVSVSRRSIKRKVKGAEINSHIEQSFLPWYFSVCFTSGNRWLTYATTNGRGGRRPRQELRRAPGIVLLEHSPRRDPPNVNSRRELPREIRSSLRQPSLLLERLRVLDWMGEHDLTLGTEKTDYTSHQTEGRHNNPGLGGPEENRGEERTHLSHVLRASVWMRDMGRHSKSRELHAQDGSSIGKGGTPDRECWSGLLLYL
ncbi:hypothetical protein J6590_017086 [Homalodisca vitripennis]|nr:hypothetical protein J6590_017086 [Homalodisca vitripennis]